VGRGNMNNCRILIIATINGTDKNNVTQIRIIFLFFIPDRILMPQAITLVATKSAIRIIYTILSDAG